MLEVITGAANSGKTGAAYSIVREAARARRRCALILPSAPDVEHARRELSQDAPLGLEIVRMDRFVETLWDLTGDGRVVMSTQERQLTLSSLARGMGLTPSFARLADLSIADLCEQTGEGWRSAAGTPSRAGEGLARLIRAYAEYLQAHSRIELAEAAQWANISKQSQYECIVIHRFSDVSASQAAVIRHCAESIDVYCTLTLHEGIVATESAQLLLQLLQPDRVRALPVEHSWTSPEIGELSEALFTRPGAVQARGAVSFSLADGDSAQAERIAEEIGKARREGSAKSPEQIAVVFRDPSRHYLGLARAFRDAGIRADFDIRIPFRNTPLGNALLDVLDFIRTGDRKSLLSFLRSAQSGLSREGVRAIEADWRKRGITSTRVLIGDLEAYDSQLSSRLQSLMRSRSQPLTRRALEDLAALAAASCGSNRQNQGEQRGRDVELDSMAYSAFVRLLTTVGRAESLDAGYDDLIEMARRLEVTPREVERPGHVQVVPAGRMRGRRFETVIIGGLNQGEFPRQPDEKAADGGALRGVLQAFGARTDGRDDELFERALFYETITRARNRIVFSAVSADDDGGPVALSPFFEAVADHYRDAESALPPHEHRGLAEAPSGGPYAGPRELIRLDAARGERGNPVAVAAASRAQKRRVGLTDQQVISLGTVSPSAIERYLSCPYRWYYQNVLGPWQLEREFDAREEGDIAHGLLARTYAALADDGLTPLRYDLLPAALEVLGREYEASAGKQADQPAMELIGRRRAKAWAARILEEDAYEPTGFTPTHFEFTIGTTEDPLLLGKLRLKGRVDRIDLDDQGGAIIVDYKRSADQDYGAKQLLKNGLVQVPLYMMAAGQRLGVTPQGGFYRGLSKSVRRGLVRSGVLDDASLTRGDALDDAAFDQLLANTLALSEDAVERMRQGDIEPSPRSSKSCSSCPVAPMCGEKL